MSNPPPLPEASSPVTATKSMKFENCWSCRILSGGGLMASALYVLVHARKSTRTGAPPSMAAIAQMMFGMGLAAWGIVVIADPVGKSKEKE